jgi:hypothetical protein
MREECKRIAGALAPLDYEVLSFSTESLQQGCGYLPYIQIKIREILPDAEATHDGV